MQNRPYSYQYAIMHFLYDYRHVMGLILFAVLLRFPFIFISSEGISFRMLTYHDEGAFLYQGREVFQGFMPYERMWDNRAPFGWYLFSIIYAISSGKLWIVRAFTLLLVSATALIVRKIGRQYSAQTGLLAACLYLIFSSTIQASQSLSYDHIFAFFFSYLVWRTITFNGSRKSLALIALSYVICCQLLANALIIGLPVTLIMAARISSNVEDYKKFLLHVVFYGVILLGAASLSFFLLWLFYWWNDLDELLLFSLSKAPLIVARKPSGLNLIYSVIPSIGAFYSQYYKFLFSYQYWLLPTLPALFLVFFLYSNITTGLKQWKYTAICILLLFSLIMIGIRGPLFSYYNLQIMPVLCIASACIINVRTLLKPFILLVIMIGVYHISTPVFAAYKPHIAVLKGRKEWNQITFNDPRYKLAKAINQSNVAGNIFACFNQTELYFMTGRRTSSHFIMPYHRRKKVMRAVEPFYGNVHDRIIENAPVFIIDTHKGNCKGNKNLRELIKNKYHVYYRTKKYLLYKKIPK